MEVRSSVGLSSSGATGSPMSLLSRPLAASREYQQQHADSTLLSLGARRIAQAGGGSWTPGDAAVAARDYLKDRTVETLEMGELPALLCDYKRIVDSLAERRVRQAQSIRELSDARCASRFCHLTHGDLRLCEIGGPTRDESAPPCRFGCSCGSCTHT